jgi:hypothetical protein
VAIQGDGKIVAAGLTEGAGPNSTTASSQFAVVRVNTIGSVDATFGNAGLVVTAVTSGGDSANAVVIQSDAKIVLGGDGLARYLPSAPQIGSFTASPNPVTAGSSVTRTTWNITDGNPTSAVMQTAFYVDATSLFPVPGNAISNEPSVPLSR